MRKIVLIFKGSPNICLVKKFQNRLFFLTGEARAGREHVSPREELVAPPVLSAPSADAHVGVDRGHHGSHVAGAGHGLVSAAEKAKKALQFIEHVAKQNAYSFSAVYALVARK